MSKQKRTMGKMYYDLQRRCYNEKDITYKSFGGRGIGICPEWQDRKNFYEWCKQNGWQDGMRVTLIDKNKDYGPDNCYIAASNFKKIDDITVSDLSLSAFGVKISSHPIYSHYRGMTNRCYNEKNNRYCDYGGRGITVCPEWLGKFGVIKFIIWSLENGWEEGLTIDRIDNDRGYSPDNCRWTTKKVQNRNKRRTKFYEFNGESLTIQQISDKTGVSVWRLRDRVKKGMAIVEAISDAKKAEERAMARKANPKVSLKDDIHFSNGNINFAGVERKYGISTVELKVLLNHGVELFDAILELKSNQLSIQN